jgi:hypothetical protein
VAASLIGLQHGSLSLVSRSGASEARPCLVSRWR